MAVNDSAATLEGNSVQVNVLANDDVEGGGTGNCMSYATIISVSAPSNGSASVGTDTITYTPTGLGPDSFTYTIQDPVTQEQSTATVYVTTYADPYPAYLVAVGAANQAYQSAMVATAASAQGMVDAAAATAATQAAAAYSQYLAKFDVASSDYSDAIAAAESAYADAEDDADATRDAANAAAKSALVAALDVADAADDAWEDAAEAYSAAADAAFAAQASAVGPYEAAMNSALAAFEADPSNSTLLQALNDAIAAFEAAALSANDTLESALVSAEADYMPSETASLAANDALSAAIDVFTDALNAANDQWNSTMQGAYSEYLSDKATADSEFVAAEADAWTEYSDDLPDVNASLAANTATAQATFGSQSAANAATWAGSEQTAWDAYESALNALPVAVAPGDRIDGPADAGVGPPAAPPAVAPGPNVVPVPLAPLDPPLTREEQLFILQVRELRRQLAVHVDYAQWHESRNTELLQEARDKQRDLDQTRVAVNTLRASPNPAPAAINALENLIGNLIAERDAKIGAASWHRDQAATRRQQADAVRTQLRNLTVP